MLPTKFRFILQSGFRRKLFLEIDQLEIRIAWKIFFSETALPKWAEIWWEAPMEGSVLSFLKAEWKVSDTGSVGWASSLIIHPATKL
jgi:hypothetical protein